MDLEYMKCMRKTVANLEKNPGVSIGPLFSILFHILLQKSKNWIPLTVLNHILKSNVVQKYFK